MNKKVTLLTSLLIAIFALVIAVGIKASTNESGKGWPWSGSDTDGVFNNGDEAGTGWISMNNMNCDTDDNGQSNGAAGCPAAGAPMPFKYGVSIPGVNGPVTGYAWSENVGYIDFSPQNNCGVAYTAASCAAPDASGVAANGGVKRVGNELQGWGRVVNIAQESLNGNSGGWSGWIKFKGNAQSGGSYGVVINSAETGFDKTYAWSDELGYIDFSRATIDACVPNGSYSSGPTCSTLDCGDPANCGRPNNASCDAIDNCGNPVSLPLASCGGSCVSAQCPACPANTGTQGWKEVQTD